MTAEAWTLLVVFLVVLIALSYPLSLWLARVGSSEPMPGFLGRFERLIYRLAGVDPDRDMPWTSYALALLAFNALGVLVVYLVQRLQAVLPLNPQTLPNVSADSSFNTAMSFVTNTELAGLLRRVDA